MQFDLKMFITMLAALVVAHIIASFLDTLFLNKANEKLAAKMAG